MNTVASKPYTALSTTMDAEMIRRVLAGDQSAYTRIVEKYTPYLTQIGRAYGLSYSDTEDLVQESFIDIYYHLDSFHFKSTFKTWIAQIMLHECYHRRVKLNKRKNIVTDLVSAKNEVNLLFFLKDKKYNTKKMVSNDELRNILKTAISQLPRQYSTVFNLREENGMSVKQTASIMHISESNVKTRLCRAKDMLREEIRVMMPERTKSLSYRAY